MAATMRRMKHILFATALACFVAALVTAPVQAGNKDRQVKCEDTKEKIQRLQTKMRHGYTARQGIRMDDQMRRLKKKRSEYCR